jgi:hypothetical protein
LPVDEDLFFEELNKKIAGSKAKTDVNEVVFDTAGTYGSQKK